MAKITYENKEAINIDTSIPAKNKCMADDMNEIKNIVNITLGTIKLGSDDWSSSSTYYKNQIIAYKNKVYINKTGTNTSTAPNSDTTNWGVVDYDYLMGAVKKLPYVMGDDPIPIVYTDIQGIQGGMYVYDEDFASLIITEGNTNIADCGTRCLINFNKMAETLGIYLITGEVYFYKKDSNVWKGGKTANSFVKLLAVGSAPATCSIGDMYYNTTTKKLYTATTTNTWGSIATTPSLNTMYVVVNSNDYTSYVYNGTDLVVSSGGGGVSNDHLVNVGTSVDTSYKVNVLKGKNILNESFVTGVGLDTSTGNTYSASNRASTSFVEVKPNTEYTISGCTLVVVCCYSSSQSFLGYVTTTTFTTLNNTKFIRVCVNSNNSYTNAMIELGDQATTYEPYITPTINVDGEDIYKQDNIDIVDITSKFSFNSGFSIANGKIYKQGKHIFGQITIKGTIPTTQQAIGTTAFPPKTYITIAGTITTSNDEWGIPSGWCYVYLSSNGNIQVLASTQGQALRFDVDYCIAD